MLITLQAGLDRILHNRAMSMTGLDPDELAAVVMAKTDAQGLDVDAHLLSLRSDPPRDALQDEHLVGLKHWREVNDMLDDIRARFWVQVEHDIDRAHRGDKNPLTFVDGIPEHPQYARVTRTSLIAFIETHFPRATDSMDLAAATEDDDPDAPDSMSRRETYTAKMLALAAKDVAARLPQYMKPDGTVDRKNIALHWLKQLTEDDHDSGLGWSNIAKRISAGLEALDKYRRDDS